MKTKIILSTLALSMLSFNAISQEEGKDAKRAELRKEMKENMKARKVAYITKELELTPEESEKFWAVHNKMEDELIALKKHHKPNKSEKLDDLSDSEVESIMQDAFTLKEKEIEIRKKYHSEFKAILGIKRTAKFYHLDKGANKRMKMQTPGQKPFAPPHDRKPAPENH